MTLREWAIQSIAAFAGGMIAVVFANFVRNLYFHMRSRDWDLW
jgi:hypothetical protein